MLMKSVTVGGILVEKHLTKFKPRWRLLGFGVACIWPHEWHMNGASYGIIAHVYLVNNCGLYLKERRKWCMYCTQVEAYGIVTHMFLQVFYVDYFKKLVLTLAESKLDKYKEMLTQCHKLFNEVVGKPCAYGIVGRQFLLYNEDVQRKGSKLQNEQHKMQFQENYMRVRKRDFLDFLSSQRV